MRRRFIIVIPKDDGGVEIHRMKEWLYQHSEHIPAGIDVKNTGSPPVAEALRKLGWTVDQTESEVRLMLPGIQSTAEDLDALLGNDRYISG
jgi:hypothetical protein